MSGVRYTAFLTGTPDSLTDLALDKVFTVSATLRGSTSSYISLTVPWGYFEEINNRPNGDIKLYRTVHPDGSAELVHTVNFNDFRFDRGASTRIITISGTTTVGFTGPKTVVLTDVESDDLQANGKRLVVCSPFYDVKPGDTIDYDSVQSVIEIVRITANGSSSKLALTEA